MAFFKMDKGSPSVSQSKSLPRPFCRSNLTNFDTGLNLTGLSLQGMRIGPIDPKKGVSQVGVAAEAKTISNKQHFDTTIFQKKDRTGFGGGFKIPEEHRLRKEN